MTIIFLDIDGTLLSGHGVNAKITQRTKAALIQAQMAGAILVLASGRPYLGMATYARELKMAAFGGYCLCSNGAQVVHVATDDVLFNQTISPENAQLILRHLEKFDCIPMITHGNYCVVENVYHNMIHLDGIGAYNIIEHESHENGYLLKEVRNLADYVTFPLTKILVAAESDYLSKHVTDMKAPTIEIANSDFTAPFYYEWTDFGVDKAFAIDTVFQQQLGFSKLEMIAFGDGPNDSTMIQYVGTGVAMGNAKAEVQAIADEVTLTNDADGIAVWLETKGYC